MCYLRNFTPILKTPLQKDEISRESPQDYHSSNAPSSELLFGFDFLRNEKIVAQQNFTSDLFASLMQLAQKNTVAIDKICEVKIFLFRKFLRMTFCLRRSRSKETSRTQGQT